MRADKSQQESPVMRTSIVSDSSVGQVELNVMTRPDKIESKIEGEKARR